MEDFENDNENDNNLSLIMDQAPLNMSMDQQLDKVLSELHSDNNGDNTFTDPTTLNLSLEPSTINEEYEERNLKTDVQTDDIKLDEDKRQIRVVKVQPVAYYDELFTHVEKQVPPTRQEIPDVIPEVEKENGNQQITIQTSIPASARRTLQLKSILKSAMQRKDSQHTAADTAVGHTSVIDVAKVHKPSKISNIQSCAVLTISDKNTIEGEKRKILPSNPPPELNITIPQSQVQKVTESQKAMIFKPRDRNAHKQIICVQQLVDNSKIEKPVPLDKQLPGFLYCDKCSWKTKDKGHYRKHMTWLCKALKKSTTSKM